MYLVYNGLRSEKILLLTRANKRNENTKHSAIEQRELYQNTRQKEPRRNYQPKEKKL